MTTFADLLATLLISAGAIALAFGIAVVAGLLRDDKPGRKRRR